MIDSYLSLYTKETPRWNRVEDVSAALGFDNLVASTTLDFLQSKEVSAEYITEVVEAATRVNYGQDSDVIHALEGAVSMAADNAAGIAGGNWQVFDQFLQRSGSTVHLKTPVSMPSTSNSSAWLTPSLGDKYPTQRPPMGRQECSRCTNLRSSHPRCSFPPKSPGSPPTHRRQNTAPTLC